jgi:hypothetical protein
MDSVILWPTGGLGNILFGYAFIYSLARKNNCKFLIYTGEASAREDRPNISAYENLFTNKSFIGNDELVQLRPAVFQEPYNDLSFIHLPSLSRSILFKGYFQSYKYFEEYLPEIKKNLFNNIESLVIQQRKVYEDLAEGLTVMIHIRRGDYKLNPDIHPILSEEYYKNSLEKLEKFDRLLIFAEDTDEIAGWNIWSGKNCVFVKEKDPLSSMILMSFCDAFIIANSTFSLWSWYLRENESATIIYPKNWFGPNGPKYDSIVSYKGIEI